MTVWLSKLALPRLQEAALARCLQALHGQGADGWRALDGLWLYAYSAAAPAIPDGPAIKCVALAPTCDLPGAAAREPVAVHYIVETDVLPEFEDEFNAWYDQEHLPGLAGVPGTIRARRYKAVGQSPRYYACYDLKSADAFGSPEWLAVRASGWSSRVRPAFRNTRRTMFRRDGLR
ncbi:hypothetical protein [Ottowia sp.]|uniref:hypothetical protein n=1 Tax=Ottowia sp. TaxID=1898956 RepID=UPI0039E50BA9